MRNLTIKEVRKKLEKDKNLFLEVIGSATVSGSLPPSVYYSKEWSDYDCVCSYAAAFLINYNLVRYWEDLENEEIDISVVESYNKAMTTPILQAVILDESGDELFKVFQINDRIKIEACLSV